MFDIFKQHKLPLILGGIIMVLLVTIIIVINNAPEESILAEDLEYTDFFYSDEVLTPALSSLVSENEHKDYISASPQTSFSFANPEYFYAAEDQSPKNTSIAAFATAASVLLDQPILPSSLTDQDYSFATLAEQFNLHIEEVPAMNSNILNYYLDNDYIVIIKASGEEPYTSDGAYLTVIAAYPDTESYLVSSPINTNYRNNLITRIAVLSTIKSDFHFYAISNPSLGDNS